MDVATSHTHSPRHDVQPRRLGAPKIGDHAASTLLNTSRLRGLSTRVPPPVRLAAGASRRAKPSFTFQKTIPPALQSKNNRIAPHEPAQRLAAPLLTLAKTFPPRRWSEHQPNQPTQAHPKAPMEVDGFAPTAPRLHSRCSPTELHPLTGQ